MADNIPVSQEVSVGLAIFGSRVTEMSPSDLPEGVSPDCQDNIFLPGEVGNRPCLHRLFSLIPDNATVTYHKTFVQSNGNPLTLILDSMGRLWQEDVNNNPFVLTQFGKVVAGSTCTSVTAQGREYMVFHNNIHGTDIPRQYDGTNLDRLSQDAVGGNCEFANVPLAPANMDVSGGSNVGVTSITPIDPITTEEGTVIWQFLEIQTTSPHGLTVGQPFQIIGTSHTAYNSYAQVVTSVIDATHFTIAYNSSDSIASSGGNIAPIGGSCVSNGVGYIKTQSPLNVQVGFQLKILGSIGAGVNVTGISISNGIATFSCDRNTGLTPNAYIQYFGPGPQFVANITSVSRAGDITTVTTATAHNLQSSVPVNIVGVADASFNISGIPVLTVIDGTHFTYENIDTDATSTGGLIQQVWPLNPSTVFQIQTVPSATSFTVSIGYPDSSWTGGVWQPLTDGTFYITKVISPTYFEVKVPNWCNTIFGINVHYTAVTVTPYGQMAPGLKQMVVLFQTRNGLVVGPCVPVTINVSGGQYGLATRVPIGPSTTSSRIIAFTGSGGSNFFYLPVAPQVNGVIVGTSTVINDNVTTELFMDFSDNSLFQGIAIDIQGNDLFELDVMGPVLDVHFYASRLSLSGMPNQVPNLINMGFDGGYYADAPNMPLGWTQVTTGGVLVNSPLDSGGQAWAISGGISPGPNSGQIAQSAYEDYLGIPISKPETTYQMMFRGINTGGLHPTGSIVFELSSASTGFSSKAQIGISEIILAPGFLTVNFNLPTPNNIPSDFMFNAYGINMTLGQTIVLDELFMVDSEAPWQLPASFSYVKNLESFDGETGHLGPTDDVSPIQTMFEHRDSLMMLTSLGLHETQDSAQGEPGSWPIREVSLFCGAAGPRAADTGENFSIWLSGPSVTPGAGLGCYVYTGGAVYKVSQEIQPDFDKINTAVISSSVIKIDPITRRIYVACPINGATANNVIYPLDYRELDVASDLVNRAPIHISYTGKMICSDLSRKWTLWNMFVNSMAIISRPNGVTQFTIGSGNGEKPGNSGGFGSVYFLDPTKYTDDDFGQVNPYYTTYFFINHEMEAALQVGLHRKLFKRWSAYCSVVGLFNITPYANNLANPYPNGPLWPQSLVTQLNDIGDGLNVDAERAAFKISSIPLPGQTDNGFSLQKLVITLMQHPVSPIRYGAI